MSEIAKKEILNKVEEVIRQYKALRSNGVYTNVVPNQTNTDSFCLEITGMIAVINLKINISELTKLSQDKVEKKLVNLIVDTLRNYSPEQDYSDRVYQLIQDDMEWMVTVGEEGTLEMLYDDARLFNNAVINMLYISIR